MRRAYAARFNPRNTRGNRLRIFATSRPRFFSKFNNIRRSSLHATRRENGVG